MIKYIILTLIILTNYSLVRAENSNPLCQSLYDYRDNELFGYLEQANNDKPFEVYKLWAEHVNDLEAIKQELQNNKPFITSESILILTILTKSLSSRLLNLLALGSGKAGESIALAQEITIEVINQYKKANTSKLLFETVYKIAKSRVKNQTASSTIEVFKSTAGLINDLKNLPQESNQLKKYKSEYTKQIDKINNAIDKVKQKQADYTWTIESINVKQNWIVGYCATTEIKYSNRWGVDFSQRF